MQIRAVQSALGALLLYATNMLAIILSAMIVMLVSGFVPPEVRRLVRTWVRLGLVLAALALSAVAVPLTAHTIEGAADQRFSRAVLAAVDEWDAQARLVELERDAGPDRATVDVVVASSSEPEPAWRLAEMLAAVVATPIDVTVEYRAEQHDEATAG